MIVGSVLSAILLLGPLVAFSTPVPTTENPGDENLQRTKQQLMEKLKEIFLKHLAEEKGENEFGDAVTHIRFHGHGSSSLSPVTALTLSLPTQSAPPRSVRICLQRPRRCYKVHQDRPNTYEDHAFWNYTITFSHRIVFTTVTVRFHTKGFRLFPGLTPTLEVRMGSESMRRSGVVLRQLSRSGRSKRDVSLSDPSPVWNHGPCGLHRWVLNSSHLVLPNMNLSIVRPELIRLDYCAGQCAGEADMTDNARARQRYRNRFSLASGEGPPPAVCVPTAYEPGYLVVQVDNEKQNLHFDRFSATGCTCH